MDALLLPVINDNLGGKTESTIAHIEKITKEAKTKVAKAMVQEIEIFHEKGMGTRLGNPPEKIRSHSGMENLKDCMPQKEEKENMQWEPKPKQTNEPKFKFHMGSSRDEETSMIDQEKESPCRGPMAMTFSNEEG